MSNAIGIDLGGTNIKYGIVDRDGNILYESMMPTGSDPVNPRVLDNLKKTIAEMRHIASSNGLKIEGIGIGAPGIIDEGIVTACAGNLPEMEGMPLGRLLEEYAQIPVVVDNDANLMGLAETRFGAAKGMIDTVFLTIGTGVGGALVLNGKLYSGHRNRGTEMGHIRVAFPGNPCSCGGTGCLEAHASVTALIEEYKQLLTGRESPAGTSVDGKFIVSRFHENEKAAVLAMNRHFEYLASAIAGLINIFSPQQVIIGGGITEAGDFYVHAIRQRALRMAMKETSVHTRIEPALLGNKAGFLGAAALVFDNTLTFD
jgi:glucokinase